MEKVQGTFYKNKKFIIEKLITYLQKELNIEYFSYKISDMDGNIADILVKKDSRIFKENIEGKEYVNFNIEELIDSRIFDNFDEIIITNLNFDGELMDLEYLRDSLKYYYLSYSEKVRKNLAEFASKKLFIGGI